VALQGRGADRKNPKSQTAGRGGGAEKVPVLTSGPILEKFLLGKWAGWALNRPESEAIGVIMAGTGRKPYATYDVQPFGAWERLKPPASLGKPERRAFFDLISRVPAGQFCEADLPLLCRWAELTVMGEQAAGELAAGGMVTPDGKVSPWFSIHQQATKSLALLALRLRLGPQSRASKAPKTLVGELSYYDRRALEDTHDDDDEANPS
jgi:hypothetical protein